MLDKNKAIRKITQIRQNGGPRHTYIFKCIIFHCPKEIKVRCDALKKASGKCGRHSHIKKPFESIYNGLFNDHRNTIIELTYEEFLEFTNIKNCYYCNENINWNEYGTINGKFISRAYFLDRKDNKGPYSKNNCVVCCSRCNKIKKSLNDKEFIDLCKQITNNHLE